MSVSITISGTTYNLPTQGQNPPYGSDLSDIIQALADVANTNQGTGDILTTSFTIANNQAVAANVVGASWDTSVIRSAIVQYSIYRSSNTPNELSETGHIYLTYKSTANTWDLAQSYAGSSGTTFSITSAGQLQYVSTDIGSGAYVGKMKFNAKAFTQT